MIDVVNIRVRTFDLDHLDIFWEVPSVEEDLSRYDFTILRCIDGPGGPFNQISAPLHNTFMYRDPDVHLLYKWRQYHYIIRVASKDTGRTKDYGPVRLDAPPDRLALEIQRRNNLLFSEFAGRKALLYPVLTFGQKCRHCVDGGPQGNTIGRSKQQNCITCYDSRYVGGYASPILIHTQYDPSSKGTQRTDTVEMALSNTTARLSNFPPVKVKDMIVEAENRRWQVENVNATEKLRATVHQELQLHEIPRGDVRYRVPVNLDLLTLHSPPREFSRPMDIGKTQDVPFPGPLGGLI